eukprot:CAMPEP_0170454078 /NCGR_PEP_ID=MMETSP0123-20130129/2448_1 /TAXON_ID=182087 /ORGANISM="Favella ehrenbergii, Strain Fehren 1" /LENGTH=60 /DNA_ID=CAMNT_0010716667 /DNA_START=2260 /DNA_END=2442 /DNA_ORIENTATION=-
MRAFSPADPAFKWALRALWSSLVVLNKVTTFFCEAAFAMLPRGRASGASSAASCAPGCWC